LSKHILLLTYFFPPMRNGGVGRPWSFFRRLPDQGIDVTVLTTEANESLPPELEKGRVLRLSFTPGTCYRDHKWEKEAFSAVMSLKKERKIDCVYATFPLASTLVVGSKIKRELGIPFIAEFRDGLTLESLFPMYEKIRKRAEALEEDVFREADRIVAVTSGAAEMYREKYGRPVHKIYNGFDPEDFRLVGKRKTPDSRHDMVLFGSILASRSTEKRTYSYLNFLGALKVLKEKGFIHKENFSLSFIGRSVPDERDLVKQFKLTEFINFFAPMPKEEGLAWMASSFDSLLEYGSPGDNSVVCGKLLEYINLGMPIFGVCKGSESEDIISRTRTGLVCGFGLEEVANGLIRFLQGDYDFDPDREEIEKFNRVGLTVQVAEVIKAVCP